MPKRERFWHTVGWRVLVLSAYAITAVFPQPWPSACGQPSVSMGGFQLASPYCPKDPNFLTPGIKPGKQPHLRGGPRGTVSYSHPEAHWPSPHPSQSRWGRFLSCPLSCLMESLGKWNAYPKAQTGHEGIRKKTQLASTQALKATAHISGDRE